MDRLAGFLQNHRLIGIDTPVFIYLLEDVTRYAVATDAIFQALVEATFAAVTSVVTLMEVTAQPLALGRDDAARDYRDAISLLPNLKVAAVSGEAALVAAHLRARHRLRPADALQLGTCLTEGATGLITNDHRLGRVVDLDVLLLDDLLPASTS